MTCGMIQIIGARLGIDGKQLIDPRHDTGRDPVVWVKFEDVRNLVETATLAGAVIGSGKPFKQRRVAIEKNISNQPSKCRAEVSQASVGLGATDSVRLAAAGSDGAGATGANESSVGGLHQGGRTDDG